KCKGSLHKLSYLPPPPPGPDREALAGSSVERYRQWLVAECGYIQLDGLPADTDLSALRMTLERLFVPLKLITSEIRVKSLSVIENAIYSKIAIGEFLAERSRFALLAKPGAGKSTLLKRLAVAYADPKRRAEAEDGLPDRDWLPLFLRCRELRDR